MKNLENAKKIQEQEERMREIKYEYEQEKFKDINFCKNFISKNNEYIKANLNEVFTPQISQE